MGVDDEQGPWWTRPPEPGPEDAAGQRAQPRPDQSAQDPWRDPHAPPGPEPAAVEQNGFGPLPSRPSAFAPPPVDQPPADQPTPMEPATRPSTEPAEPPGPPRPRPPAVHRVAVVPPDGPDPGLEPGGVEPGSARRDTGQTETLPAVPDDIFAVFAGPGTQPTARAQPPGPQAYAPDPREPDPLGHLRDEPHDRHRPHVPMPSPRVLLIGAAGGLVVLLIVITALVTGGGSGDESKIAGKATPRSATVQPAGQQPKGLHKLTDAQASDLLAKAGAGNPGTIVEAWDWQDHNGHNLVVASVSPAGRGKQDLRVIELAELEKDRPRTLRVMRDPNLPANCQSGGTAAFTPGALQVRDLNGDGIAEVTAGWTSRCGAKGSASTAKLAVITDGKKYIIRGDGVVGRAGSGDSTADPRAGKWPDSFLRQARSLFAKFYY